MKQKLIELTKQLDIDCEILKQKLLSKQASYIDIVKLKFSYMVKLLQAIVKRN